MKHMLVTVLFFASSNVFASKFVEIKKLSNVALEQSRTQLLNQEFSFFSSTKKVLELKGKGTTPQQLRESAIGQAMHTLCPYFDDGVNIGINTKNDLGSKRATLDLTESSDLNEDDETFIEILSAIKTANAQKDVEVYSGNTSGNNTSGTVLGFYDVKNNELAVFANTNCGSED